MKFFNRLACAAALFTGMALASASSFKSITTDQQIAEADGVFRGTVLKMESFIENGLIQTRTFLRVDEVFKGKLPRIVKVIHNGGVVGNIGMQDGFSPRFKTGEEKVLFVSRNANGLLFASNGSASALAVHDKLLQQLRAKTVNATLVGSDLTDQSGDIGVGGGQSTIDGTGTSSTATGLITDASNISSRFVASDRGEAIQYLIDADALPAGITLTQATNAVVTAMNAWTAVSSVKYQFAGIQSFGSAANLIATNDGKIRIQLHDLYNSISGSTTLGIGGRYYSTTILSGSGWTTGGNVAGNDFHATLCGFVVLKHTQTDLQTLSTFTEVLCHELGHVLSLAHSSENQSEPNTTLKQAMMYFIAHEDGRGATLGTYDPPVLRQVHPTNNTPPFTYNRMMDVVTFPFTNTSVAGVNEIEVRAYDLQTTNLLVLVTNATTFNGAFSLAPANKLKYVPADFFEAERIDPSTNNSYYDHCYARIFDGTNASPYAAIRVLSLNADSDSDGVPDNWMTKYFGDPDPNIGTGHHATDDFDGDRLTNLQEFLLGTDPTNKNSSLHFTSATISQLQWEAKGYELYEVQSSTNLTSWTRRIAPLVPLTGTGSVSNIADLSPKQFFRVVKVP